MTCHYPEDGTPENLDGSEVSNSAILNKVNQVFALLEEIKRDPHTVGHGETPGVTHHTGPHQNNPDPLIDSRHNGGGSAFADAGFGQLEIPNAAARTSACESIVKWPAMTSLMVQDEGAITFFRLQEASLSGETSTHGPQQAGGIPQDNILSLCQRFLTLIHVKNPILDVPGFVHHARIASEIGPKWDEGGCLVVSCPPDHGQCRFRC